MREVYPNDDTHDPLARLRITNRNRHGRCRGQLFRVSKAVEATLYSDKIGALCAFGKI